MRTLPAGLRRQLRTARRIERLAVGLHNERAAVSATGALMLAAVEAGWTRTEIATVLGMHHQTVARRVETARERFCNAKPGLLVEPPPSRRPPHPLAVLRQPVAERQWLSRVEAAEFVGCDVETIWNWRRRGLLPNTQRPKPRVYLYLRADLQRVMRAPQYKNRGVNYRALRAQIEASPV